MKIAFEALFSAVFRERRKRDLNPISLPRIIDIYCVSFGSCCKPCCKEFLTGQLYNKKSPLWSSGTRPKGATIYYNRAICTHCFFSPVEIIIQKDSFLSLINTVNITCPVMLKKSPAGGQGIKTTRP